jgi:NAD+ diphosphatase
MGEFVRARGALPGAGEQVCWFIFRGRELLLSGRPDQAVEAGTLFAAPRGARGTGGSLDEAGALLIGRLDGVPCLTASLPDGAEIPEAMVARDLFRLYGSVDDQTYAIAAYAYQIA